MRDKVFVLFVLSVLVSACSIQADEEGVFTNEGRVKKAEARATEVAVDIVEQNAALDYQARLQNLEFEQDAHKVAVEATKVAYTVQISATLLQAAADADAIIARGLADADAIRTRGDSAAKVTAALGNAGAAAVYIFGVGAVVALTILSLGRAIANVKQAARAADYARIGVEPLTLLPPPLIITNDGYLIDTRSGERARIRDSVGVDRLRLAATTHTTEVALLSAAETQIAKLTKSDRASDALMGVAGSIPILDVSD